MFRWGGRLGRGGLPGRRGGMPAAAPPAVAWGPPPGRSQWTWRAAEPPRAWEGSDWPFSDGRASACPASATRVLPPSISFTRCHNPPRTPLPPAAVNLGRICTHLRGRGPPPWPRPARLGRPRGRGRSAWSARRGREARGCCWRRRGCWGLRGCVRADGQARALPVGIGVGRGGSGRVSHWF